MMREWRLGRPPPNGGRRWPAQIYTDDEIQQLLDHGRLRARGNRSYTTLAMVRTEAMIYLSWRCGLRVGELVDLELDDVDLGVKTLDVRHGKGDRRRLLGVPDDALEALRRWMDIRAELKIPPEHRRRLFVTVLPTWTGYPCTVTAWRSTLLRLRQRARVHKRVHPHGFRHTFAVNLLRAGINVKVIQHALGHENLETTDRYLNHVSNEEVLAAMRGEYHPHLRLVQGGGQGGVGPITAPLELVEVFRRASPEELEAIGDMFHQLAAEARAEAAAIAA